MRRLVIALTWLSIAVAANVAQQPTDPTPAVPVDSIGAIVEA
jgi:hypothetical protein